ncbi:hypothetical protein BH18ACT7_BH18ACT7_19440 [soil metagenome]
MVALYPAEPAPLVVARELRRGQLDEPQDGLSVALLDEGLLSAIDKALHGELADRLEKTEPGRPVHLVGLDQALVRE